MLVPEKLEETISILRKNDAYYQEKLDTICAMSEDYFRIMESLSKGDRERLEQYMELTQELDERTIQLVACHYALSGAKTYKESQS